VGGSPDPLTTVTAGLPCLRGAIKHAVAKVWRSGDRPTTLRTVMTFGRSYQALSNKPV